MAQFTADLSRRPEVLEVYFVAGANDFLVHVATASTDALRASWATRSTATPPSRAPRPT